MSSPGGSRTQSYTVLPSTLAELRKVVQHAKSFEPYELAHQLVMELSITKRSVEWLKEHGKCLDNLVPAVSSHLLAARTRGAMARRNLHTGEMIVPVPLLHISDRDALYMTNNNNHGTAGESQQSQQQQQLLLNYCFGHSESSLLLCPLSNAAFINHCSSRTGRTSSTSTAGAGPNAILRWATDWHEPTKDWLDRSLEEISDVCIVVPTNQPTNQPTKCTHPQL
jgi:hypothetical protein